MMRRDDIDIAGNVETYLGARVDTARYSSCDYCFNYFQDFHDTCNVAALTDAGAVREACVQPPPGPSLACLGGPTD